MTAWYGSRLLRTPAGAKLISRAAAAWTALRYARLSRRVASEIADYCDSGFEVIEILGVGASPSCGVMTTINLEGAMVAMSLCPLHSLDAHAVNGRVVAANVVGGSGLFIRRLQQNLRRRGILVTFREHDLLGELRQSGLLA